MIIQLVAYTNQLCYRFFWHNEKETTSPQLCHYRAELAQSRFNGTWRANSASLEYHGSNKYSLQNGIWRCDRCVPGIAIKADGHKYRVNSSLYYGAPADIESVREVNDHSIEIADKVSGKVVGINKLSASDDGKTLTTDWRLFPTMVKRVEENSTPSV